MAAREYDFDTESLGEQNQSTMMTQSYSTMMTPQPGMMAPVRPHRECRTPAKMVAICDMVVNSLYLAFLLVLIILVAYPIPDLEDHVRELLRYPESQPTSPELKDFIFYARVVLIVIIMILLIIAGFIGLQLWIAVGLLKSTYIGTPAGQAIQKAKCWMCCHICLVVMNLLSGGSVFIRPSSNVDSMYSSSDSSYITQADGFTISFGGVNLVILLLRILFIFIVHSFIQQLRSVGGPMM